MTVAMFKEKFKCFASRLCSDFDPRYTDNEHLMVRYWPKSDTGLAENDTLSITLIARLKTIYVEEAIAVTVNNHVFYVFRSGNFWDFKYEIFKRLEMENPYFDIFKGIDHEQQRVE